MLSRISKPARQRPHPLRRFFRNPDGNASVEMALAIPVFLLIVVGIMEVALLLFAQVLAEGSLREASRFGLTGQSPQGVSREQQVVDIVKQHTHGLIQASAENVTFTVYPSFEDISAGEPLTDDVDGDGELDPGDTYDDLNGNGNWDPDNGTPGVGGPGEVVLYRIVYTWEWVTPIFAVFGGPNGGLEMSATAAIRNEPYIPGAGQT